MECKSIGVILVFLSLFVVAVLINLSIAFAAPVGPTITYRENTTLADVSATEVNYTGSASKAGGYIFTATLNSNQQNDRWKAFVGNVTGTLVLQDADGWSIYDWSITTSLTGEVYATRSSSTISWADVACATNSNVTNEEIALSHTSNPNDNISATFDASDNSAFDVGIVSISANTCNTTNLYVNGSAPTNGNFEEVLLHDGSSMVYTSIIEQDADGYNTNDTGRTYDFQMLVPEVGLSSWVSSTAYYFYVELA